VSGRTPSRLKRNGRGPFEGVSTCPQARTHAGRTRDNSIGGSGTGGAAYGLGLKAKQPRSFLRSGRTKLIAYGPRIKATIEAALNLAMGSTTGKGTVLATWGTPSTGNA